MPEQQHLLVHLSWHRVRFQASMYQRQLQQESAPKQRTMQACCRRWRWMKRVASADEARCQASRKEGEAEVKGKEKAGDRRRV